MSKLHDISDRIVQLYKNDEHVRTRLVKAGTLGNGYDPKMEKVHIANAQALETIIDEYGFPTVDLVGEEASAASWFIIQHAISVPSFMLKCSNLLAQAVAEGKANPISYAYLSDRIAVLQGNIQLYGTQFDWDGHGLLSPQPYDNVQSVNERRLRLGMKSLEEHTEEIRNRARRENHQPPDNLELRKVEELKWRRKVGWIVA